MSLGATACGGPQSALDPAGPAAGMIATSWWLMLAGAALAWTLVVVLLLLAMRRGRALGEAAGRRMILAGGILLPATAVIALLVYGTLASDRLTGRGGEAVQVVRVTARQWQWQFDYLDADGRVLTTTIDQLLLPRGEMVEFHVGSEDVIHSFWIPRLGGKIDAIPGRTNVLRLRADAGGAIRGQCAEFCGLEHSRMAFAVEVREAREHRAWLRARSAPGGGP